MNPFGEGQHGRVETKPHNTAGGCILLLIGFILLFFFPLGTLFGVLFIILAVVKSKKLVCSNCGNRVEKESKLCPTCRTILIR